jgi:putative transposase
MAKWKKLSHTIYQCKYHIVWCPKYRYRILKGALSKYVEQTLRMLCEWRNIELLEMNVREDHIHPALKRKPYWGNHFWSRGYCVSTIGLDENKI